MSNNLKEIATELVTEEEIDRILENPNDYSAYVGYEPSGVLHIGHMVTANVMMELQELGIDVKILIADLHAELNQKGENADEVGKLMEQQLKAFGLSDDTDFIYGSDFQMTEEYQRMVHKFCQTVTSSRAERSMAEISHGESTKVSHLLYPVMQSADIWYMDVDIAVGGMEQRKVHMLARDIFPKQNIEKPSFIHTPLIADLDTGDGKMSTSEGVSISSADSEQELEDKVRSAYCPTDRPEENKENPVLQMYRYHIFPRKDSITIEREDEYGGDVTYDSYKSLESDLYLGNLHPSDAKSTLAKELNELLEPVREVH